MNAQEIIEYIRTSEKKTPVKVYVWEKAPVAFPNCRSRFRIVLLKVVWVMYSCSAVRV